MKNLREYLEEQINENLIQAVLSAGRNKDGISKIKIRPIRLKGQICYQASATEGQKVLHKNYGRTELIEYVEKELAENFRQFQAQGAVTDGVVLVSKKGKMTIKQKHHEQGKIIHARYDKFRQINRFLEFIEDILPRLSRDREITILDFGCGKSYLTFAMYYYLRELKGYDVNIIGLDLKTDVIEKCNSLALRYGYEKLHFYHGDIADYEGVSCVDMVVTLHACDTATDYALAKAVEWGAEVILSVPCCQHEVNKQIKNEMLEPVLRYGILKERMSALITDAVRADLLESKGYDTQILEFIDMEHTPKNLLIRAVRTGKRSDQGKVEKMLAALNIHPTLDRLLNEKEQEGSVR
jgi:SAM-dependent methyltransferase